MAQTEDMVMDGLLSQDKSLLDGSSYSMMDKKEQSTYDKLAFEYYAKAFSERDMNKYGKLSFENFITGLTPEEAFITQLAQAAAGEGQGTTASMWNEVFGENTPEMAQAAMGYRNQNDVTMGMEDPKYANIIAR